jgi:uncharacterized protein YeaO (DUF488 family)
MRSSFPWQAMTTGAGPYSGGIASSRGRIAPPDRTAQARPVAKSGTEAGMSRPSVSPQIELKRVYEPASRGDGTRILVDRLWPRGLRKEDAAIDHWLKDLAPSTALRKWFGHDVGRWAEFRKRYRAELAEHPEALAELRSLALKGPITLLFAAHDEVHNNAVVLRELLARRVTTGTSTKTAGKPRRRE